MRANVSSGRLPTRVALAFGSGFLPPKESTCHLLSHRPLRFCSNQGLSGKPTHVPPVSLAGRAECQGPEHTSFERAEAPPGPFTPLPEVVGSTADAGRIRRARCQVTEEALTVLRGGHIALLDVKDRGVGEPTPRKAKSQHARPDLG